MLKIEMKGWKQRFETVKAELKRVDAESARESIRADQAEWRAKEKYKA